jgi:hypothetical protein
VLNFADQLACKRIPMGRDPRSESNTLKAHPRGVSTRITRSIFLPEQNPRKAHQDQNMIQDAVIGRIRNCIGGRICGDGMVVKR